MTDERPLRIDLSPSRRLAAAIVTVHCGAGACAGLVLAGPAGILLGALIAGLGVAAARDRALLRGRRSVRALQIQGKDRVTMELANAELVPIRIGSQRYVSRLGVILRTSDSMRRTIIVARDMLDPGAFRALRLWALWGRLPPARLPQPTGGAPDRPERTISKGNCL